MLSKISCLATSGSNDSKFLGLYSSPFTMGPASLRRERGRFAGLAEGTSATVASCVWLIRHIAAFGNAVLEIIPLRLCIGFPSRPLRRVGLDRQRATRLGKLRANRDCLVWMRFRPRFSQQSGSRRRQGEERSESLEFFFHGGLSAFRVLGGRKNRGRKMTRTPPKNCLAARRSTRQSERWFNSATYAAAEF